jgi:hypothetical protein
MTTSNVSTPHTSKHPKCLTSKSLLTFQNIHRGHFIGRIDTIILPLANTHRLGAHHGQSTVSPQSIDRFLDPPLSTTVQARGRFTDGHSARKLDAASAYCLCLFWPIPVCGLPSFGPATRPVDLHTGRWANSFQNLDGCQNG